MSLGPVLAVPTLVAVCPEWDVGDALAVTIAVPVAPALFELHNEADVRLVEDPAGDIDDVGVSPLEAVAVMLASERGADGVMVGEDVASMDCDALALPVTLADVRPLTVADAVLASDFDDEPLAVMLGAEDGEQPTAALHNADGVVESRPVSVITALQVVVPVVLVLILTEPLPDPSRAMDAVGEPVISVGGGEADTREVTDDEPLPLMLADELKDDACETDARVLLLVDGEPDGDPDMRGERETVPVTEPDDVGAARLRDAAPVALPLLRAEAEREVSPVGNDDCTLLFDALGDGLACCDAEGDPLPIDVARALDVVLKDELREAGAVRDCERVESTDRVEEMEREFVEEPEPLRDMAGDRLPLPDTDTLRDARPLADGEYDAMSVPERVRTDEGEGLDEDEGDREVAAERDGDSDPDGVLDERPDPLTVPDVESVPVLEAHTVADRERTAEPDRVGVGDADRERAPLVVTHDVGEPLGLPLRDAVADVEREIVGEGDDEGDPELDGVSEVNGRDDMLILADLDADGVVDTLRVTRAVPQPDGLVDGVRVPVAQPDDECVGVTVAQPVAVNDTRTVGLSDTLTRDVALLVAQPLGEPDSVTDTDGERVPEGVDDVDKVTDELAHTLGVRVPEIELDGEPVPEPLRELEPHAEPLRVTDAL